jgi:dipeptidyl-peptidase-4
MPGDDPFLAQWARTRQFSLGVPRAITVSSDGRRVLFTRTRTGSDPVSCLWAMDLTDGQERLLLDPEDLVVQTGPISVEEQAQRERTRERAVGITAYATDAAHRHAVVAVSGQLWAVQIDSGRLARVSVPEPVFDPRPNPSFSAIAYVVGRALHVFILDPATEDWDAGSLSGLDATLAAPESEDITFGLAEHVAAEEMGRFRGFWWSPDGDRLLVARVDTAPVSRWGLADISEPAATPIPLAYPAAGGANAAVSLHLVDLHGRRTDVDLSRATDHDVEYVVAVQWSTAGLLVSAQNRAQTRHTVFEIDPTTGVGHVVVQSENRNWTTIVPGVPTTGGNGTVIWVDDQDDTRTLIIDGRPVSPAGLQVRAVLGTDADTVLFTAATEPTEDHVWTYNQGAGCQPVTTEPGCHTATAGGGTIVVTARTAQDPYTRVEVRSASRRLTEIVSVAEHPILRPQPRSLLAGDRRIRTVVLFPDGHVPGSGLLPVLLDPYGGPGGRRVLSDLGAYLLPQWWANQGYAVLIADGAGTPGRSPSWERSIHHDGFGAALEDQVVALHSASAEFSDLDLSRVGIRGWSYGGTLAAAAVLRRPDIFHAAVAGAAVTNQRLCNTHYQERYLGHPDEHAAVYEQYSLVHSAGALSRPLMLIHGLADDNVMPAHSVQMSAALWAAAKPHELVLLPMTSHTPIDPTTVTNILKIQADFLHRSLGEQT